MAILAFFTVYAQRGFKNNLKKNKNSSEVKNNLKRFLGFLWGNPNGGSQTGA